MFSDRLEILKFHPVVIESNGFLLIRHIGRASIDGEKDMVGLTAYRCSFKNDIHTSENKHALMPSNTNTYASRVWIVV